MKKQYEDFALVEMLSKLEIEQIDEIRKEFAEQYPDSSHFRLLCSIAKGKVKNREKRIEFVSLIEQYKNTPSDATNI